MRKFPQIMAAALAFASGAASFETAQGAQLNARRFQKCMHVVTLQRGSADGLNFDGDGFNCHGLKGWKTSHGVTAVSGQLSHRLTARKDDQVNFSFNIYPDGAVDEMKIHINRGGFVRTYMNPWASSDLNAKSLIFSLPAKAMDIAAQQLDGSWEGVARSLVLAMAGKFAYARRVAESGEELPVDQRAFYYNIAPRAVGTERLQHTNNESDCRQMCYDWKSCEVWSFQNRRKSDGKAGERWCKLYPKGYYNGFRSQTRSITGRVRDTSPKPKQPHISTETVKAGAGSSGSCNPAAEPKLPKEAPPPAKSRPGFEWAPGHNRCVDGKWRYVKPAWVHKRAH